VVLDSPQSAQPRFLEKLLPTPTTGICFLLRYILNKPKTNLYPSGDGPMCVGCFVISAFTLFLPPSDLPPTSVVLTSEPIAPTVIELRSALAEMKEALPATTTTELLRQELQNLQTQLAQTNDLETTEILVDEGLGQLRDRILSAPNADELIEVLYQMREERYQKSQTFSSSRQGQTFAWGWLG